MPMSASSTSTCSRCSSSMPPPRTTRSARLPDSRAAAPRPLPGSPRHRPRRARDALERGQASRQARRRGCERCLRVGLPSHRRQTDNERGAATFAGALRLTVPSWASTRFLTIDSPSPSPACRRVVDPSPWRNGSNTLGEKSAGIPLPVSATIISALLPARRICTVNGTALGRELHRVRQQVRDEPAAAATDRRRLGRAAARHRMPRWMPLASAPAAPPAAHHARSR